MIATQPRAEAIGAWHDGVTLPIRVVLGCGCKSLPNPEGRTRVSICRWVVFAADDRQRAAR